MGKVISVATPAGDLRYVYVTSLVSKADRLEFVILVLWITYAVAAKRIKPSYTSLDVVER